MTLDNVRFCHGSPRRDDEILTRITPEEVLSEALSGVGEPLVVGGHTHQQVIRAIRPDLTYANAGSVGMPYEGRPGAFWMVVATGVPQVRETSYHVQSAIIELQGSGFPDVDDMVGESLVQPVDPEWVSAFFEHGAGRAEAPEPPRPATHD